MISDDLQWLKLGMSRSWDAARVTGMSRFQGYSPWLDAAWRYI